MATSNCWKCKAEIDEHARAMGRCGSCGAPVSRVPRANETSAGGHGEVSRTAPTLALEDAGSDTVHDRTGASVHDLIEAMRASGEQTRGEQKTRMDAGRDGNPLITSVVGPQAGATQRKEGVATVVGGLRRYKGGGFVTADGVDVEEGTGGIELPYTKDDVRMRIGAYDILRELGRGGMGVVFLAYSLKLCRQVAVKMMTSGRFASEAEIVRFQNEAMLAARLEHPHIVPVYDSGEHDGNLYFVMGFVEGTGFGVIIDAQATAKKAGERAEFHLERGLKILAKSARALDFAHRRGIVHRDVKPDNIIVDAHDEPHVTDFGIAKNVQREISITKPGAIVGTPTYMAPEQANNIADRIGPAADVYSLGATLYHLATGRAPFEGPTALAILIAVLQKLPDPPKGVAKKTLGRDLPEDLETIILKAMEKRASDRYESARAFAEDLESYLADKPVSARPVGAGERLKKLLRRNRAAFAMAMVAVVTLVFMAVGFGTVLAFNLSRTSDTLWAQDEQSGRDQAATLERAIVANMVEGRADIVRSLVDKLRKDPKVTKIEVVRTDKTLAYIDDATRAAIGQRLIDPEVRRLISAKNPGFDKQIAMLESVAFANIDASVAVDAPTFQYDDAKWRELLKQREAVAEVVDIDGVPHLTVLKPIPNGPTCQFCHGPVVESAADANPYANMYGPKNPDPENRTRAVLVVHRSQADVKAKIADNTRDTLLIGGGTTLGFLAVLFLAIKLFGVRLRPQRYG